MPSIQINLTPFVSGLEDKPHNDDALWPSMIVRDATDALLRICALIDRPMTGITLKDWNDSTDVLARVQGQPKPVPLATIMTGLASDELIAAHQTYLTRLRKAADHAA